MMSRIRVVMGTQYPRDPESIHGGIEGVASCLVEALAGRDDIELHVVSCRHGLSTRERERRRGYTIHWLPTGPVPVGIAGITSASWAVLGAYRALTPQIIHSQGAWAYSIRKPLRTPLLLTIHGVECLERSAGSRLQYAGLLGAYRRIAELWTLKLGLRQATGLVSIAGPYVPSLMSGVSTLPARIYEIDNPVLPSFWDVKPSEVSAPRVILSVGSVIPRKNALAIVSALPLIHQKAPGTVVEFAGAILDSSYHSRVLLLAKTLGLSQFITFLGQLDQSALFRAYGRATVVAHPALQETSPLAIAQAMAAERAVVAMNVGGVAALVDDGVTGYLVNPGDIDGFADRIASVVVDQNRGRALGAAGRKTATSRFSPRAVAQSTVNAYVEQVTEANRVS